MKKQVQHLKVGDILTSGDEVIEAPFDSINCPSGKCNLVIRYKSGAQVRRQWWKRTEVATKDPVLFPGIPPQPPRSSNTSFNYSGDSRL